jgi:gamma-glutamyltranspeptidase/glutathione hydrolase
VKTGLFRCWGAAFLFQALCLPTTAHSFGDAAKPLGYHQVLQARLKLMTHRLLPVREAAQVAARISHCRAAVALFCALAVGQVAAEPAVPIQPEGASGFSAKPGWTYPHSAVAAAHPLAADAGQQMLRAGGSAIDAAIAVQLVLTLVEPQSSGIGGGAFLMFWDGAQLSALDGRETAPAAADEKLFLKPDGRAMSFAQAVEGGRAVGTPGLLRMLELAHRQHGRLAWARLFEPAIRLSEAGFELSARTHKLLSEEGGALQRDAQAAAYFFDASGQPWPAGHRLRNPALAEVLRQVAAGGADAFLMGPVAQDIVRRVRGHGGNPGLLAESDLASYAPKKRPPLCTDWRSDGGSKTSSKTGSKDSSAVPPSGWRVCGFPPPSSGHLTIMQMLGMLAPQGAGQALSAGLPSVAWLHRYTEAARLAFADRDFYIADPDFVAAPGGAWESLLAPDYLRQRADLIAARSIGVARAGQPTAQRLSWAPQAEQPEFGTSHISVVDAAGRAVALTTSIESGFGARLMSDGGTGLAGGFLLNNQLTDFALQPRGADGLPVANRVEGGKRPRSSMSPTLVFDRRDGRLLMSLGSPGGPAIIHFVAKTLIATHDWGMDAQQAINLPNFGSFNGPTVLEQGFFPASTAAGLRALGHRVFETDLPSGLQAIQRRGSGWFGAADPRRDGVVRGD